jgi:hypothetical protein
MEGISRITYIAFQRKPRQIDGAASSPGLASSQTVHGLLASVASGAGTVSPGESVRFVGKV